MTGRSAALLAAALAATSLTVAKAAGPDINRGQLLAATGGFPENRVVACARCHQLNGTGDSSGAFPRLADQSGWYLYKTLHDYAVGLRPSETMQPIARELTDQDMRDLAGYYASIKDPPYPGSTSIDPLTLQIGGALVAAGAPAQGVPACSSCHGQDGVGNPPVAPFIAGQYASYVQLQLQLWKQGKREGDPLNVMRNVAQSMTDDQIRAVSLYLASVRNRTITPQEASLRPSGAAQPSAASGSVETPATGMGVVPKLQQQQNPGAASSAQPSAK